MQELQDKLSFSFIVGLTEEDGSIQDADDGSFNLRVGRQYQVHGRPNETQLSQQDDRFAFVRAVRQYLLTGSFPGDVGSTKKKRKNFQKRISNAGFFLRRGELFKQRGRDSAALPVALSIEQVFVRCAIRLTFGEFENIMKVAHDEAGHTGQGKLLKKLATLIHVHGDMVKLVKEYLRKCSCTRLKVPRTINKAPVHPIRTKKPFHKVYLRPRQCLILIGIL